MTAGGEQRIVQTVHGRGYRFVAPVEELADAIERPVLPVSPDLRQEIRFCTTADGTRLAYATVGSGPPLVRAAHWITHLDYDWQSPVWRHWLVGLARQRTLVRYDERGCGLSDHDVDDFSLDAWVRGSRRPSSTTSDSTASRCSVSPKVVRSRSRTRRAIRSG